MPKTNKQKRAQRRENFLAGRARKPHKKSNELNRSLTEEDDSLPGPSSETTCPQCRPILLKYATMFGELVHQGSELKKRKHQYPHPKKHDAVAYRDLKCQNEWLRQNVFDTLGNYLYCCSCICAALKISKQRIAHQRKIKREESQIPIVEMSKSEVEAQRLGAFVIMPDGLELAFTKWWTPLTHDTVVQVRYPHSRHGNAGKTSHSAKTTTKNDFLLFVDCNSQPNGRSADSSGPTHYFLPKFSTIQTPKPNVSHYADRVKRSIVGEFNRAQKEAGKGVCSNGSAHNWLKADRPKVGICPHQEDYCDTCSRAKERIRAKQTTLNRLLQSAQSEADVNQRIEDEITALKQELENHRQVAQGSHQYYIEVTSKCKSDSEVITQLEAKPALTDEEQEKLTVMKHKFNVVLAADYQMSKLLPYWGLSPQPGSTYYLQKLSHDIFGIVNHATSKSSVYLLDERVGPKNTDHTVSYMTDYIANLPPWIRRVHLFLDNTCSTNKNYYTMAWACEMIRHGRCDFIRISFLIAGHTKFSPDILFSNVAKTFNQHDVFNTKELRDLIAVYADVKVDEGLIVHDWREPLAAKYTKFPGIRTAHDFIFAKNSVTGDVTVKTRPLCYTGAFANATIQVKTHQDATENVIPGEEQTYSVLNKIKTLSASKLSNIKQMCEQFIPVERHFPFLSS